MILRFAVLCTLLSTVAFAVDGVVLIDQNRALVGNVTAGDTPGFPVSITQPGSYRLSGKLTAPANVDGVVIAASGVTLDLNGFSIEGPSIVCTSCPSLYAIRVEGSRGGITVRNGTTLGFSGGLNLVSAAYSLLDGVAALGGLGLFSNERPVSIGRFSIIRNTTAAHSFELTCPVAVADSVTDSIRFIPVSAAPPSTGVGACKVHNTIGTFLGF